MPKLRKVISASRRCDLITFYPEYLIESLQNIPESEIHTIVLWTKNPLNLLTNSRLQKQLEKYSNLYMLLTITGLGGTSVEPMVPEPCIILKNLPRVIDILGGPKHIAVRYDPLLHIIKQDTADNVSNIKLKTFLPIIDEMAYNGIKRLIVSVAQIYRKAISRMNQSNFIFADNFQARAEEFISQEIAGEAIKRDIILDCCTSPNLGSRGCIDGSLLGEIHPKHFPAITSKDHSQREYCSCSKSTDIGKWFSCPHGCVYCYGNPKLPAERS